MRVPKKCPSWSRWWSPVMIVSALAASAHSRIRLSASSSRTRFTVSAGWTRTVKLPISCFASRILVGRSGEVERGDVDVGIGNDPRHATGCGETPGQRVPRRRRSPRPYGLGRRHSAGAVASAFPSRSVAVPRGQLRSWYGLPVWPAARPHGRRPREATTIGLSQEAFRVPRLSSSIAHGVPWVKGCFGRKRRSTCGMGYMVGSCRTEQPGPDHEHDRTKRRRKPWSCIVVTS